jgi:hypothetical protein
MAKIQGQTAVPIWKSPGWPATCPLPPALGAGLGFNPLRLRGEPLDQAAIRTHERGS